VLRRGDLRAELDEEVYGRTNMFTSSSRRKTKSNFFFCGKCTVYLLDKFSEIVEARTFARRIQRVIERRVYEGRTLSTDRALTLCDLQPLGAVGQQLALEFELVGDAVLYTFGFQYAVASLRGMQYTAYSRPVFSVQSATLLHAQHQF
jgi:hypothetical protein